jgi:hypothetical protein
MFKKVEVLEIDVLEDWVFSNVEHDVCKMKT